MRFDRLDLNLLAAFDVLAETRSVSEAARRLNLSQPAVSGALNRLRDFFEDELLVPSGRQMLLTPKAEELAEPVRRALMLVRAEITRPGRFDAATTHRRFIVVASDYAYTILFAGLIAEAAHLAPGISFEILPPSSDAVDRLGRAEIDLFVTVEPYRIARHPGLALWRDDEVIISWAESGYRTMDEDVFFAAGHAVVLFGADRRPSLSDVYYGQIERERRIELLLPNFAALPQAVVGTRRLATMHRLYAEHFARHFPIQIHENWAPLPDIVEVAQWHEVRARDPGMIWLLDLVRSHVSRLPARARLT